MGFPQGTAQPVNLFLKQQNVSDKLSSLPHETFLEERCAL